MRKLTTEDFIKRAREIHGGKYNYSLTEYIGSKTKVKVICPEHGVFEQWPGDHYKGRGCPICGHNKKLTKEVFIERAKKIHGDKYDYSLAEYVGYEIKIKIICSIHGEFLQTPHEHLSGSGCSFCGNLKKGTSASREEFIEKVKKIHGDKYDYSLVDYKNNKTKVTLICPIHGKFDVRPDVFLVREQDCPKCSNNGVSKGEKEVSEFIKSIYNGTILENKKEIIPPFELDVYLPEKKLAFEYHGLYWHSKKQLEKSGRDAKNYHLNKLKLAHNNGIRLIQIFEDEWANKKEIVKSKIKHILEVYDVKIEDKQIYINNISIKEKDLFLNLYHIQGKDKSKFKYGAFYNNVLVGVMTFCESDNFLDKKEYRLSRFAIKEGYDIQELAGKMFEYFVNNEKATSVYAYSDVRWDKLHGNSSLYEKIGMRYISSIEPNCYYVSDSKRKYRFDLKKNELLKASEDKLDKIFDCGNDKYIWKRI